MSRCFVKPKLQLQEEEKASHCHLYINHRNSSFKSGLNLVCAKEEEEVAKEKRQVTNHSACITKCISQKYFHTLSDYVLLKKGARDLHGLI